jgi:hypothetical protein
LRTRGSRSANLFSMTRRSTYKHLRPFWLSANQTSPHRVPLHYRHRRPAEPFRRSFHERGTAASPKFFNGLAICRRSSGILRCVHRPCAFHQFRDFASRPTRSYFWPGIRIHGWFEWEPTRAGPRPVTRCLRGNHSIDGAIADLPVLGILCSRSTLS